MRLVWHIVRKDLWLTRYYLAAAFVVLLLHTWSYSRILSSRGAEQGAAFGTQIPLDWLLAISAALTYGVLLHNEALPGTRQYWIARPIRWQTLLAAKLLVLPILAIPVVVAHWVQLALRDFSLAEYGLPVLWNAVWLVFAGLLPVAVLASLSRNLQQLTLWILAFTGGVLGEQLLDRSLPGELYWVVSDVTIVAGVTGSLGILIWQYATRRSGATRVFTVLFAGMLATLGHWPAGVWRALQHSRDGAIGALSVGPSIEWNGPSAGELAYATYGNLRIPYHAEGLAPGAGTFFHHWDIKLVSGSASTTDVQFGGGRPGILRDGEVSLTTQSGFLARHSETPIDIDLTAELTVFSAPQYHPVPVNGSRFVPGIGRCEGWVDNVQIIDCQSVLGRAAQLSIQPVWKQGETPRTPKFPQGELHSPFLVVPRLHPIELLLRFIPLNLNSTPSELYLETREPVAHVQRKLQLRGIQLIKYQRDPKRAPGSIR